MAALDEAPTSDKQFTSDLGISSSPNEGLLYMLNNQLLCDVSFIAGVAKHEVKAHRVLLASQSAVFRVMFCGILAQLDAPVEVPDIKHDILMNLFRYIYSETCPITHETVVNLAYAAKKYEINGLYDKCIRFLHSSIDNENVLPVLQTAYVFDEQALFEKCLAFVYAYPSDVFKAIGLSEFRPCIAKFLVSNSIINPDKNRNCLHTLMTVQENLNSPSELPHFNSPHWTSLIKNLLFLVRMPFMPYFVFLRMVSGVSEEAEEKIIFQEISLNEKKMERFIFQHNKENEPIMISRLEDPRMSHQHAFYCCNTVLREQLTLSCSKSIYLIGLCVFRPVDKGQSRVYVYIEDTACTLLLNIQNKLSCCKDACHVNVLFPKPILLPNSTCYTITLTCIGVETYLGTPSNNAIYYDDLVFNFTGEICSVGNITERKSAIRGFLVQTKN